MNKILVYTECYEHESMLDAHDYEMMCKFHCKSFVVVVKSEVFTKPGVTHGRLENMRILNHRTA
jgi:hypothetical protein